MKAPLAKLAAPGFLLGALVFLGCAEACAPASPSSLTILSYNVENLFDGQDSGREYPEFSVAQGKWDEARYRVRLQRLAEVLLAAAPETKGPDIACFLEVENRQVLEDLRLGPLAASTYAVSALVPSPDQAVNCAILSRYPLVELRAHALKAGSRGGRHILEARFAVQDRRLVVLVNHWKSKLEGARATEGERQEAAALLSDRVAALLGQDPACELLACGDFNEGPDEYAKVGEAYPTALMPLAQAGPGARRGGVLWIAPAPAEAGPSPYGPALYSPWAESDGYSYVNKGERERIDGFLLAPGLLDDSGLAYQGFSPLKAAFLVDGQGRPLAYQAASGRGYSDHLPLVLSLALRPGGDK